MSRGIAAAVGEHLMFLDADLAGLGPREIDLLALLLRESGRTVTREHALEEIWFGAAEPNVVDRYVTRLRSKLGEPPLIRTIRGTGFTLRA